jgi:hypothetical protein
VGNYGLLGTALEVNRPLREGTGVQGLPGLFGKARSGSRLFADGLALLFEPLVEDGSSYMASTILSSLGSRSFSARLNRVFLAVFSRSNGEVQLQGF